MALAPPPSATAARAVRRRGAVLSTIGSKTTMALTGLGLLLFVIAHMLGNLQVFAGPDQLNGYAKKIQGLGPILWLLRIGLLSLFVVHVATALRLTRLNRAARPVRYVSAEPQVTSYAARTMVASGLIVLAFVVYHLLHFTLHVTNPSHVVTTDGHVDVYGMVVRGFQQWPIAIAYLVAQGMLALHVSHGASSAFQTLGTAHPRLAFLRKGFGPAVGAAIFLGNASIPLSILAGLVH